MRCPECFKEMYLCEVTMSETIWKCSECKKKFEEEDE